MILTIEQATIVYCNMAQLDNIGGRAASIAISGTDIIVNQYESGDVSIRKNDDTPDERYDNFRAFGDAYGLI